MRIKLIREWLGSPEGTVLEVYEDIGRRLVSQGAAMNLDDAVQNHPPKDKRMNRPPSIKSQNLTAV